MWLLEIKNHICGLLIWISIDQNCVQAPGTFHIIISFNLQTTSLSLQTLQKEHCPWPRDATSPLTPLWSPTTLLTPLHTRTWLPQCPQTMAGILCLEGFSSSWNALPSHWYLAGPWHYPKRLFLQNFNHWSPASFKFCLVSSYEIYLVHPTFASPFSPCSTLLHRLALTVF